MNTLTSRWERGVLATSFLHVSKQLAGQRPFSATPSNCDFPPLDRVWARKGSPAVCLNVSAFGRSGRSNPSASWLVDANLWRVDHRRRSMDGFFVDMRRDSHSLGHIRRHVGDDRARCMVHGCIFVRSEAFRVSSAVDVFPSPSDGLASFPHKGGDRSHE